MLFRDERRHGRGFAVVDVRLATRQPTRLTSLEGNITDIMEIALRVVLKADGGASTPGQVEGKEQPLPQKRARDQLSGSRATQGDYKRAHNELDSESRS